MGEQEAGACVAAGWAFLLGSGSGPAGWLATARDALLDKGALKRDTLGR